jgi:glyoxylase-like metal-dependent hydrolase (beta-lactamase superfamily II)
MRVAMALAVSCAIGLGVTLSVGTLSAAPAPALGAPQTRVEDAYAAMGWANRGFGDGAQARETLLIMTSKGSMMQWDPGQSQSVSNLMVPDWGKSTFTQVWDRSRAATRTQWVRPRAGGGTRNYTEILTEEGGYVIGADANGAQPARAIQTQGNNPQPLKTMSAIRARALLREVERNGIVFFMHDRLQRVSDYPAQTVAGKSYPSVQFRGDSGTFIVMFDPQTKLPAIVRTRDFDQFMGDANFDATYTDWRDVNGVKFPFHINYTLNGQKVFETQIDSITFNTQIAADTFNVPAAVRGKAPPPQATLAKVPNQWILRRLASGFYLDSDALYTDDGKSLQLVDIAPNISHVTGGSHNTLIVATNDYLVAFDAPGDDGQSQWVINAAKQKYPGKSFRYVVLTHHHIDHAGGIRAFAADGATIVTGQGNGAFFRRVLAAPAGSNPYRLASFTPKVIEVANKWTVNDGGRVIEAYLIETPHAAGYLIPYVPDARLAFVTDLWNPGGMIPAMPNPLMVSVVRGMERAGIQPERFAGGHGSVGPYADLAQAVQRAGGG